MYTAPFFQSFVEVRVEPDRLIVRPYGVHGRLRWRDFDRSAAAAGSHINPDDYAEWVSKPAVGVP